MTTQMEKKLKTLGLLAALVIPASALAAYLINPVAQRVVAPVAAQVQAVDKRVVTLEAQRAEDEKRRSEDLERMRNIDGKLDRLIDMHLRKGSP